MEDSLRYKIFENFNDVRQRKLANILALKASTIEIMFNAFQKSEVKLISQKLSFIQNEHPHRHRT